MRGPHKLAALLIAHHQELQGQQPELQRLARGVVHPQLESSQEVVADRAIAIGRRVEIEDLMGQSEVEVARAGRRRDGVHRGAHPFEGVPSGGWEARGEQTDRARQPQARRAFQQPLRQGRTQGAQAHIADMGDRAQAPACSKISSANAESRARAAWVSAALNWPRARRKPAARMFSPAIAAGPRRRQSASCKLARARR